MNTVNDKTADSKHTLISRAGLVAFAELVKPLKLAERVDPLMPKGARNRAFCSSAIFNTFMLDAPRWCQVSRRCASVAT